MSTIFRTIVGIGVGALSSVFLVLMQRFPSLGIFVSLLAGWLVVLFLVHRVLYRRSLFRQSILWLSLGTAVSLTGLAIVVESAEARTALSALTAVLLGILYAWAIGEKEQADHTHKPFRRFAMMLWVFNTYALFTFFFALGAFFPSSMLFFFLVLLGGVIASAVSLMVWREYYHAGIHTFFIWAFLVGLATIEMMWVLHLLPFAYTVLGLCMAWIWYIMQLLIRFHFSRRGIAWKNQAAFLIVNAVLFLLIILFVVRWV